MLTAGAVVVLLALVPMRAQELTTLGMTDPGIIIRMGPASSKCAAVTMNMIEAAWVEGYLNGAQTAWAGARGVAHGGQDDARWRVVTLDAMQAYVRNYCRKHPTADLDDAAMSLFVRTLVKEE
jgi:hypothetical protein